MWQARLVAGFQREHLPSEESGEESRLIHPGHTSISSSYYWVGFFFSLSLFSICSADLTFAGKILAATGTKPGCCTRGWPEGPCHSLHAPGSSPGITGRSGWKRRDWCKSPEPPCTCSALTQKQTHNAIPVPQFPLPSEVCWGATWAL